MHSICVFVYVYTCHKDVMQQEQWRYGIFYFIFLLFCSILQLNFELYFLFHMVKIYSTYVMMK